MVDYAFDHGKLWPRIYRRRCCDPHGQSSTFGELGGDAEYLPMPPGAGFISKIVRQFGHAAEFPPVAQRGMTSNAAYAPARALRGLERAAPT